MIIKKGKAQVTFVYTPANSSSRVELVGTFNDWRPAEGKMVRQKDGTFRKRLHLAAGQYRYKFLVDGQWTDDPDAEERLPNDYGTCDAVVSVG